MSARIHAGRLLLAALALVALLNSAALAPGLASLVATTSGRSRFVALAVLAALAAALAGCLLALVLIARAWSRPGTRALAVFLAAAAAVWAAILRVMTFDVAGGELVARAGSDNVASAYVFLAGLMLASAAFLNFSARFPAVLGPEDVRAARGPKWLASLRALALRPAVVWSLAIAWPLLALVVLALTVVAVIALATPGAGVAVGGMLAVPATVTTLAFPVACMALGSHNLIVGYRRADADGRRRVQWLLVGLVVSTWMTLLPMVVLPFVPLLPPWLASLYSDALLLVGGLAPAIQLVGIALAMFYTGGIDAALVLRRSTVLGALGTLWVVAFAALEALLSDWLAAALHVPNAVASVGVAAAAAALALPLRGRVTALVTSVAGGEDGGGASSDGAAGALRA